MARLNQIEIIFTNAKTPNKFVYIRYFSILTIFGVNCFWYFLNSLQFIEYIICLKHQVGPCLRMHHQHVATTLMQKDYLYKVIYHLE